MKCKMNYVKCKRTNVKYKMNCEKQKKCTNCILLIDMQQFCFFFMRPQVMSSPITSPNAGEDSYRSRGSPLPGNL